MAEDDARRLGADHLRRLDISRLAHGEHDAADDARVDHPVGQREHDDRCDEPRPDHRDNEDDEEQTGKGDLHIDRAHDEQVDAAALVAGKQPKQHAEGTGEGDHGHADQQRGARAIDDAGKNVTAELIGAERMRPVTAIQPGRRLQPGQDRLHRRIIRREQRREDRHDQQQDDDDKTDEAGLVAPQLFGKHPPLAARGGAGLRRQDVGRRHGQARLMRGSIAL